MSSRIQSFFSATLLGATIWGTSLGASAATYKWVGPAKGEWNDAKHWSPEGIPGPDDSVIIEGKKKVSLSGDATISNLTVGAGAEIKNGGKIKVTKKTTSAGLFTGVGTLDVPAGATATYTVDASNSAATSTGNSAPAVVFAPINNKGRIVTKVAQGCRVDFASIQNDGATQISSDGTVTFKDIKNTHDISLSATGTLTLAKIDNASGASVFISAMTPPPEVRNLKGKTTRGDDHNKDDDDPSVVHLDTLTNHSGGKVKLVGAKDGRYFNGKSIRNEGSMQISGAQTLLDGDLTNTAGATLTIDSDATLFPSDDKAPKLKNSGKLVKLAGSDATLNVEWTNSGQVEVDEGTLHVRLPQDKKATQTGGTTTFEGGVLSLEDATDPTKKGLLTVNGGVVDGIGTIEGDVVNAGGTFKPGHSPGTITINGNFTQTAGGVLNMEVGGTTPGTGYDQILVNGTANLGGTLNIVRWNGYVPHNGDVYTLFTYYTKSGNFSKVIDATPISGIAYDTTLTPTDYELNCYETAPPDNTRPSVSISTPANNSATRTLTTATGTASDNASVAGVTCRLYRYANPTTGTGAGYWAGGSTWTATATAANERLATGADNWVFTLPPLSGARYSLRATASDASGNMATSSTISFWVDATAPSTLTIATPANGTTVTAISPLTGSVADASNGSGILSVQYRLRRVADGLYWTGTTWTSTLTTLTASVAGTIWNRSSGLPSGTNLKTGKYNLVVVATDRAGNTRTATSNFSIASPTTFAVDSSSGS